MIHRSLGWLLACCCIASVVLIFDPFGWLYCGSAAKARDLVDASFLRRASLTLLKDDPRDPGVHGTLAALIHAGCTPADRGPGSSFDPAAIRFGSRTLRQLQPCTPEELAAEIVRAFPNGPPAWQTLGPITMCLDTRAYLHKDDRDRTPIVIVSIIRSHPPNKPHRARLTIGLSDTYARTVLSDSNDAAVRELLEYSITYYDSLGIPMPPQMITDLRAALGSP